MGSICTTSAVAGTVARVRPLQAPKYGRCSHQRRESRVDIVAQYIYTMRKVRKAYGDKVILDDVTLAFLPGAKIGVVGPNGAGKSSVLKIMAGLDQASNGDAMLA